MKAKNFVYSLSGIFMMAAALFGAYTAVLVFISRLNSNEASFILAVAAAVLSFVYSIINFVLGLFVFKRKNRRQIMGNIRLGVVSIILFVVQILLSAVNGIAINHLVILAICAFVIPCFYMIASQLKM